MRWGYHRDFLMAMLEAGSPFCFLTEATQLRWGNEGGSTQCQNHLINQYFLGHTPNFPNPKISCFSSLAHRIFMRMSLEPSNTSDDFLMG